MMSIFLPGVISLPDEWHRELEGDKAENGLSSSASERTGLLFHFVENEQKELDDRKIFLPVCVKRRKPADVWHIVV